MLSGVHYYALHEWLIAAREAGYHAPVELLPKLLILGQKRENLRYFLAPVIGVRGMWLALEISNQNWNWALETPEYDLEDILAMERLQEIEMIKQLQAKPLDELIHRIS